MRALIPLVMLAALTTATSTAPAPQRVHGDIDWISWGPGSTILFDATGLYSVRPDGSGLRKLAPLAAHPVWGPDGTRIAADMGDYPGSIVLMNADGSNVHRVRRPGMYPVWSPSGDRIAFTTGRRILVMNADGSAARKVAALRWGQDPLRELDWSPDGSRVVFSQCLRFIREGDLCEGRRAGIFSASAEDALGPKRKIATHTDCPDWTPSRRIAAGSLGTIRTLEPDGSGPHVAITRPEACGAWSPNGRVLAAATQHAVILAKADGSARWRLSRLPPPPFNLASPVAPAPAWSADGKWIAVARTVGNPDRGTSSRIYLIRVRYGRKRVIVRTPFSG